MLTYSVDKHEITEVLTAFLRERAQLDRFLDENLKKELIEDGDFIPPELMKMGAVSGAARQIQILREMQDVVFCDTEEELGEIDFEKGYMPQFLTENRLRKMPKEKRLGMAKRLLEIFIRLNEEAVYPGVINLNAVVFDGGGSSERVYLSRVTRFQLGSLRQTWEEIADETHREDNRALSASFPFFDEVCQNIAYARLTDRIVKDSRLTEELERPEVFSPEELLDTLEYMEPVLLEPVIRRTGVWVISSDSLSAVDSTRYTEEMALLNTLLLSAAENTETCPVFINYFWCGRENDVRGGSGAVCSTGMMRFDGTFLPYVPFNNPRRNEEVMTGKNLIKAFVSAEHEIKRSDYDKKMLFILAPRETDNNIAKVIDICSASEIKDSFLVLFDERCSWTTTKEGDYLLNTGNPQDLRTLYRRICDAFSWNGI